MQLELPKWPRAETTDSSGLARVSGRRIYILPTRYGMLFGVLLFLMLLGAINYGNNPAYLLTFLLAGLGANAIYQTWRNLRGLELRFIGADPAFAGDIARFRFRVRSSVDEHRPAVQLGSAAAAPVAHDIPPGLQGTLFDLLTPAEDRGRLMLPRVVLATRYPLGLLRAWCYVHTDATCLVYPKPSASWPIDLPDGGELDSRGIRGDGNEDFAGLRAYRAGDSVKRVDWKSYARERGLLSKQFEGSAAAEIWLDWRDVPATGVEARLSALCRAVLDLGETGQAFGLRIPGKEIPPDHGAKHQRVCLETLALFERD